MKLLSFGEPNAFELTVGDKTIELYQPENIDKDIYYVARATNFRSAGLLNSPAGLLNLMKWLNNEIDYLVNQDGIVQGNK